MNALTRALFGPWNFRPEVVLILGTLATLYLVGWFRLRRQGKVKLAHGWRLAAYTSGMGLLAVALLSPIDMLGGQLLFMHMIQHKLSVMAAAPLIWLGNPFPIGLWGLPAPLRRRTTLFFAGESPFRRALATATQPGIVWMVFIFVYIGWHDGNLYNMALRRDWVHDLQHIMFFSAAMLYWWHVTNAGPRLHKRLPIWAVLVFLLAAVPPNAITGVVIANSSQVIYTYYESVPRIWGFSALQDQMIGGVIMWIQGSEMFIQAAIIALAFYWWKEGRKAKAEGREIGPLSGTEIADEALIAPGLEHRAVQNRFRQAQEMRPKATGAP